MYLPFKARWYALGFLVFGVVLIDQVIFHDLEPGFLGLGVIFVAGFFLLQKMAEWMD